MLVCESERFGSKEIVIMDKRILLTFDYELFLGAKSGTVDKCLIAPTNMLLDVLKRNKMKAVFFIDTTYLMRMNELKDSYTQIGNDFELIKKQLLDIAAQGHKLCHHLHPHWIDAEYIPTENQWSLLNDRRYNIETLSQEQKKQIFDFSVSFLSETTGVGKTANGYRAGGLHIEPFVTVREEFERCGIDTDYSGVAKIEDGVVSYKFENSTLSPDENGRFTEFPISQIRIHGLRKIVNGVYYRLARGSKKYKPMGNGLPSAPKKKVGNASKTKLEFSLPISVELLTPVLLAYYKKLLRKYSYVHFLSHPKLQSFATIKLLDKFLKWCNNNDVKSVF